MKLIRFRKWYDFGDDYELIIGKFNQFSILEAYFSKSEYFSWKPSISIEFQIFYNKVFGFNFRCFNLSLSVNFLCYLIYR